MTVPGNDGLPTPSSTPSVDAGSTPASDNYDDLIIDFPAESQATPSPLQDEHGMRPRPVSLVSPATLRSVAVSLAAFALGVVVARGLLTTFQYSPSSIATNQPAVIPSQPPRSPAPESPGPAPLRPSPPSALPAAVTPQTPSVAPSQPRRAPRAATPETRTAARVERAVNAPVRPPTQPNAAPTVPPRAAVAAAPSESAGVAPPPAVAPPALSLLAVEQSAVIATVREYTQAYGALDVSAAAAVWPSVDRRALARAFSTLKSQELEIGNCEVAISRNSATARCRGTVAYVRKVGDPTPRTGHQEWVFTMRKIGNDWIIDALEASPVATLPQEPRRGAT